ncbi:hypothetical protein [Paenarthrobacter sp. NEAU-H11]|uniref:hypothetical protein n=1 Tax=Paenarthrobacter sp. NEAU-H11 TaxID=3423924 RepID=UPI003D349806
MDHIRCRNDQATVAVHLEGLEATCAQIRETGVEPRMLDAFVSQLRVANAVGRGEEDFAAVADSLMAASQRFIPAVPVAPTR